MPLEIDLQGKAVLVVGASSGIGRALASVLPAAGAKVAIAARRIERLEELAAGIEGDVLPVRCDVTDEASCAEAVEATVAAYGRLDALVFASGVAVLEAIGEASADTWWKVLDVNVIGASCITKAAIAHLEAASGTAIYLSSISADEVPPRRGLGLYAASKAGLDKLIEVWGDAHKRVSFTGIHVGDTGSTEMAAEWDMTAGAEVIQEWTERGYLFGRIMEAETVARHVATLIDCPETVGSTRITPRHAV